jgi:predicted O-linked N-acetylglucosamine transferase (SPINDLY family)
MERAFDRFIDVRAKSDEEVALLARRLELDIAVDLAGFTAGSRPRIFSLRAAPLQVSYLGYSGTMGVGFMDYLIADITIVPLDCRDDYAEKIIYLPSYQANGSTRNIAEKAFDRRSLGLPPCGFVFCCFNANYKITPVNFDVWMRILKRVPGSVLFLSEATETVEKNLRREASSRGVDADRLIFGKRLPSEDYLARYRTTDLFLDTLPYNAHTTASDALWAGVPVLTCMGNTFAGRVAASLLNSIGLPELITQTLGQYEELAVDLAKNPERLGRLRQTLADNRLTAPVFDIKRFTKHLETAYHSIHERHRSGLSPDHVVVDAGLHEAAMQEGG